MTLRGEKPEPERRLELRTYRLQVGCATIALLGHHLSKPFSQKLVNSNIIKMRERSQAYSWPP